MYVFSIYLLLVIVCVCVKASSQEPRHGVPRERVRFGKTEGRRGEDSTPGEARSCTQPGARPKPRRGTAARQGGGSTPCREGGGLHTYATTGCQQHTNVHARQLIDNATNTTTPLHTYAATGCQQHANVHARQQIDDVTSSTTQLRTTATAGDSISSTTKQQVTGNTPTRTQNN